MIFDIFRQEGHGVGGIFGHKIWIDLATAGAIAADEELGDLADLITARYRDTAVTLNGREFEPTEITLFVYFSRRPATDRDDWIADKVITLELNEPS
jgi:hypothetical protein